MADEKTVEITFLIEEYKNIAATHDKLRDVLVRLFNYFLLLSAFPFTVAGIMLRASGFDLLFAPVSLHLLFFVVGVGHFFLALSLLDARLGQYRYARTVNAIRKYFADKAPGLTPYLYLPIDSNVPSWEDLGYIGFQLRFIYSVGAIFAAYGVGGLAHIVSVPVGVIGAVLMLVVYIVAYQVFKSKTLERFRKDRGIR